MIIFDYKYRLRGRGISWGIAIDISLKVENIDSLIPEGCIEINQSIFLLFSNNIKINEIEKEFIVRGINWVESSIGNTSNILLTINSIYFNPFSDFQEEGLFFCMAHWASEYFDFEMPEYEYFFDKENNKYVFPLLERK